MYIKEVVAPMFGAKHRWRRLEFAKSRGGIHFQMFAICADKPPHILRCEMEGGGSRDIAGAFAKGRPLARRAAPCRFAWGRPSRNQRTGARRRLRADERHRLRWNALSRRCVIPTPPNSVRKFVLFPRMRRILHEAPHARREKRCVIRGRFSWIPEWGRKGGNPWPV